MSTLTREEFAAMLGGDFEVPHCTLPHGCNDAPATYYIRMVHECVLEKLNFRAGYPASVSTGFVFPGCYDAMRYVVNPAPKHCMACARDIPSGQYARIAGRVDAKP